MAQRVGLTATIYATLLIARGFSAPTTPTSNVTISGVGISDHGETNLLCVPTKAYDVLLFFFSNYLAHSITVKLRPGVSMRETLWLSLNALLHPAGGINTALESILAWSWRTSPTFPFFKMDPGSLETAKRSGALVTAMRTVDWEPAPSDEVLRDLRRWEDQLRDCRKSPLKGEMNGKSPIKRYTVQPLPDYPDPGIEMVMYGSQDVHGGFKLPPGYFWGTVLPDAKLLPYGRAINSQPSTGEAEVHLTASFSITQPIVATYQALSAAWALYKTRGDQLQQYGFTAFGLTVTPYLVMSVVNFVAQLATPHYDTAYIVYSEILAEAAARVGNPKVMGIVAALAPDSSVSEEYVLFDAKVELGVTPDPLAPEAKQSGNNGTVATQSVPGAKSSLQKVQKTTERSVEAPPSGPEVVVPWPPGRQRYKTQEPSKKVNGELKQKKVLGPLLKCLQLPEPVGELIIPFHPRFEREKSTYTGIWRIFDRTSDASFAFQTLLATIIALFPLPIILVISRCKVGTQTTTAQKVIIITWLICNSLSQILIFPAGIILGLSLLPSWLAYMGLSKWFRKSWDGWKAFIDPRHLSSDYLAAALLMSTFLLLGAFSLAMFVVVGQELVEYGNCQYYG